MDAVYENFAITDECLDERLVDFDSTPIDYEDDSHGSLDSLGSNHRCLLQLHPFWDL